MVTEENIIYIHGHRWRDGTTETTPATRAYSRRQVEEVAGDHRRTHKIQYVASND